MSLTLLFPSNSNFGMIIYIYIFWQYIKKVTELTSVSSKVTSLKKWIPDSQGYIVRPTINKTKHNKTKKQKQHK